MKWPITELDQENYKMVLEHFFVPESKEAKKCMENDGGMSKGKICQFDIYKRKITGLWGEKLISLDQWQFEHHSNDSNKLLNKIGKYVSIVI